MKGYDILKRITIDISENGLIQIKSDKYNFCYSYDSMGGGMQCNFMGGTEEYNRLLNALHEVEVIIRYMDVCDLAGKPRRV